MERINGQIQTAGAKNAINSLLDMDLNVDSDLFQPLIQLDIPYQDGAFGQFRWRTEFDEEAANTEDTLKATLEDQFNILMETQKNHKEELQTTVTTLLMDVTTSYERLFQQLHQTLDMQFGFLRNHFEANLNWRLVHHHTEVLKDVKVWKKVWIQCPRKWRH